MAAPSGGGGGGGPVGFGGGVASTGQTLNYIGNHCYANSGEIAVDTSLTTMLSFGTGTNQYIVGEVQMASEGASGNDFFVEMKLNDEVIFSTFMSSDTAPYPTAARPINVLIPGDSTFSFALKSDSGTRNWTVQLVGRVYT